MGNFVGHHSLDASWNTEMRAHLLASARSQQVARENDRAGVLHPAKTGHSYYQRELFVWIGSDRLIKESERGRGRRKTLCSIVRITLGNIVEQIRNRLVGRIDDCSFIDGQNHAV